MFPLTKLVRTVGGGFRREKVVQTVVTWLSDLPKKFGIRLVNESVNVKRMSKVWNSSINIENSPQNMHECMDIFYNVLGTE